MKESITANGRRTVLGCTTETSLFLYIGFGAAGLVLGYFLPRIAAWAASLPMVPFQGPMRLISAMDGFWLNAAVAVVGLLAGLFIAAISIEEMLVVTITDQSVELKREKDREQYAAQEIQTVFLDGAQLVLLGRSGHELAREKLDESLKQAADAFRSHGYSWSADGDPFKAAYRRWVPDTPDVLPAVNALMKAREKALQKKEKADSKDLHSELAKLGYVVRDEETRQYWRKV